LNGISKPVWRTFLLNMGRHAVGELILRVRPIAGEFLAFLARAQPRMIDWGAKAGLTHGVHPCTGPGDDEFTGDSVR